MDRLDRRDLGRGEERGSSAKIEYKVEDDRQRKQAKAAWLRE